jgi:hypothetical protein
VAHSNLLVQRHLRDLGLPLAASKMQIVASNDILARQASTLSLGAGSTGEPEVRRLGRDFAWQEHKSGRAGNVHKDRLAQLRRRLRRLRKFRRAHTKLFFSRGLYLLPPSGRTYMGYRRRPSGS